MNNEYKLIIKIVFCIISIVGSILVARSMFIFLNSKNYKASRLINCIFLNEEFSKYKNEMEFCLEKDLLIEKKVNNRIEYEITNKGFDYMNSQNSLYISYFALIISLLAFFSSLMK
ncbi:MAG: hypothetical protein IJ593_08495 [Lachnospiraceae bacterium]|nr:hypothetical protein [Lachnospiraceae bacterium]